MRHVLTCVGYSVFSDRGHASPSARPASFPDARTVVEAIIYRYRAFNSDSAT